MGTTSYNYLQLIYIYYVYMYQLCTLAQLMVQHGTTNVYLTIDNGDIAVPPGRPDAGFAARSVSTASRKHIAAP